MLLERGSAAAANLAGLLRAGRAGGGADLEEYECGVPGTHDPARPVRCLGQLYSLAAAAAPRLHACGAAWAAAVGGELQPALPADSPASSGNLQFGGLLAERVAAGLVKSPARAAEKVVLCYQGDVSRLADVCRLRILLPGPEATAKCLRAIAADPAVLIVRLQNTMQPRRSAVASAGVRVSLPGPAALVQPSVWAQDIRFKGASIFPREERAGHDNDTLRLGFCRQKVHQPPPHFGNQLALPTQPTPFELSALLPGPRARREMEGSLPAGAFVFPRP